MRKPFARKTEPTKAAPTPTPAPSRLAELFAHAKIARRMTSQEVYRGLVEKLAVGTELTAEQATALEAAARELGAGPAEIENDRKALTDLAKLSGQAAKYDATAMTVEIHAAGAEIQTARERIAKLMARRAELTTLINMRHAIGREIAALKLKSWRVQPDGAPEHGEAATRAAVRSEAVLHEIQRERGSAARAIEHERRALDAIRERPAQPRHRPHL